MGSIVVVMVVMNEVVIGSLVVVMVIRNVVVKGVFCGIQRNSSSNRPLGSLEVC